MIIEVNNIEGKIIDKLPIEHLATLQQHCQFKVQGSNFMSKKYHKWDGYRKLFNIQTRRFPIGMLPRITNICKELGYNVDIVDKRIHISDVYDYSYDPSFLRDYQNQAILTSVISGNGILKVATGGGKTVIAGCTIGALKKKSIFIVHTKDLLYQAKDAFQKLFPNESIGQIGDGVIDYQNITVATMQTLAILGDVEVGKDNDEDAQYDEKIIELTRQKREAFNKYRVTVQCIMMDEVQIVCSQTARNVRFLFDSAEYAFGYSASPWRDDGSDMEIEGAFGNRIIDISASELIRKGYLVRPTIEIHDTTYVCNDSTWNYNEIYRKYIVENIERNHQVARDAVKSYESGMNTLVLVTQLKHGELIADIIKNEYCIDVQFISGKSGMKKRRQAIQDMRDGKISLLIASTIADVGLDIPRLQCIVEAGAGKSSVTALQRLGRIMRPFDGKDSCKFISYKDKAPFIKDHIGDKMAIWSTEEEFNIKMIWRE